VLPSNSKVLVLQRDFIPITEVVTHVVFDVIDKPQDDTLGGSTRLPNSVSVGLPALAGRGKEQIPEGSMPDGSSIIHKLDEPSMGESGFSRRLLPLGSYTQKLCIGRQAAYPR
jgi:hypothetical protein